MSLTSLRQEPSVSPIGTAIAVKPWNFPPLAEVVRAATTGEGESDAETESAMLGTPAGRVGFAALTFGGPCTGRDHRCCEGPVGRRAAGRGGRSCQPRPYRKG